MKSPSLDDSSIETIRKAEKPRKDEPLAVDIEVPEENPYS